MTTVNATLQDPNFPGSALDSIDLEQAMNDAAVVFDPALSNIDNIVVTSATLTRINFTLNGQSGFITGFFGDPNFIQITSFFVGLGGGASVSFSGNLTEFGGTLNSFSLNSPSFRFSFSGSANINLDTGVMSGSINQFTVGVGKLNVVVQGALFLDGITGEINGTVNSVTFDDRGLGTPPGVAFNSFQVNLPGVDIAAVESLIEGATTAQALLDSFDYSGNDALVLDFLFGANVDSGAGHDHLQGGRGNDTLNGGAGNDNIVGGQIFNILLTDGDDSLAGGDGDDSIGGGDGADTLDGGAGNDFLEGGSGNDVVSFASAPGPVTVSLATGTASADGNDTLTDIEGLRGSSFADSLTGGAGNDLLEGGSGNDTTAGGAGNDLHIVANAGDVTEELPGGGTDTVQSTINWVLQANTEHLLLLPGALSGTGNELPNVITGNAGNNTLNGGGGADTLIGGGGNDTYVLDPSDVMVDTGGTDSVIAKLSIFTPLATIENVFMGNAAGNGWIVGSAIGNHFVGNDGANLLMGGDGADTLEGGRGDDTLLGGTGNDSIDGGRGSDVMEGGVGNDIYTVSGVRDQIIELAGGGIDFVHVNAARFVLPGEVESCGVTRDGGANVTGNALGNAFDGGTGNDTFTGGGGADRFVFNETGNVDLIVDFTAGGDKLLLDPAVFAVPGTAALPFNTALPAAAFRAGAGVSAVDADDRILYDTASGALYYDGDGSGGGAAVQFATLGSATHPAIGAGDFLI